MPRKIIASITAVLIAAGGLIASSSLAEARPKGWSKGHHYGWRMKGPRHYGWTRGRHLGWHKQRGR